MAKRKSLLDRMEANRCDDWQIADIKKLCAQEGIHIEPPSHGSHYKVHSEKLDVILTIPARRPIKAAYIKNLVNMARAHRRAIEAEKEGK